MEDINAADFAANEPEQLGRGSRVSKPSARLQAMRKCIHCLRTSIDFFWKKRQLPDLHGV